MVSENLKIFSKIPRLETERLILRKISIGDINDVYDYASQPEVSEYLLWTPHTDKIYTKQYLIFLERKYKKCEFYDWGIEYKGKMIGTCGFSSFDLYNNSAEIGYVLNKNYWGMDIAREAASEVIRYGFQTLDLERICAKYITENIRSRRVMEKCKMTYEGTFRSSVKIKGSYADVGVCSITKSDYINICKNQNAK